MAKRKKKSETSAAEEFAALVGQLEKVSFQGIPKAMTPGGLEVLAFDLEEREKLARIRAWMASEGSDAPPKVIASPPKPKKMSGTEKKAEPKAAKEVKTELTPEQLKMQARIKKKKSGSSKKAKRKPNGG